MNPLAARPWELRDSLVESHVLRPMSRALMPRHAAGILTLVLGAMLHVDWHLARPLHHRLSLDWSHHWALTATVFALAGCLIARVWPAQRWRMGAIVFLGAAVLAQGVEPVLEALIYDRRFGYEGEPVRWTVFWRTLTASAIVYALTLWLCAPRQTIRTT
jgi:hypothetical protein